MDKPRCKTCPYWDELPPVEESTEEAGVCLRFPPVIPAFEDQADGAVYQGTQPWTYPTDTCGEHPEFSAYITSMKHPE